MLQVCLKGRTKQHSWCLDSGCSRHMTGDKSMFQTLSMKEGGSVGFGGHQKEKIVGTGMIGKSSISINNVWLVEGLTHNHLSISQCCDNGYDVIFNKSFCTVMNSDKSVVFKGSRKGNVYKINFSDLADQKVVCLLSVNDEKWMWHRRLGHANWRLISKLSKQQLVKSLPDISYHSDSICGACQTGKIVKESFKLKKNLKFWKSEVIMVENLKMNLLKTFVKSMELSMNSLLPELHNKMELLRERIDLYKKWPEP